MKNLFVIILFNTFLITVASSQQTDVVKSYYDPLSQTKMHEIYYVKHNTPIKHGNYKEYDEYGYLLIDKTFENNKSEGVSTTYYGANEASIMSPSKIYLGKVSGVFKYHNGELHGTQEYYNYSQEGKKIVQMRKIFDNGNEIQSIEYFSDGSIKTKVDVNGENIIMYDYETIKEKYNLINGVLEGQYTLWYDNGNIEMKGKMKNGNKIGIWKEYYKNGNLSAQMESDSNFNLIYHKKYFENGELKWQMVNVEPEIFEESSFDNVTFKIISFQQFGLNKNTTPPSKIANGLKIEYYSSGEKKSECTYAQGTKVGESKDYYINGNTLSIYQYDNNQVVGLKKTYFENGQLSSEETFKYLEYPAISSIKEGPAKYFHKNGQLKTSGKFLNDRKVEEWKYYKDDGTLDHIEFDKTEYGLTVRATKTASEISEDNAKKEFGQNFKIYSENLKIIEDKYITKDKMKSEVLGEDVFKIQKRRLYAAYVLVKDDLESQINNSSDFVFKNQKLNTGIQLTSRMIELNKENTKELERSLKNVTDINKIIQLMGIEN